MFIINMDSVAGSLAPQKGCSIAKGFHLLYFPLKRKWLCIITCLSSAPTASCSQETSANLYSCKHTQNQRTQVSFHKEFFDVEHLYNRPLSYSVLLCFKKYNCLFSLLDIIITIVQFPVNRTFSQNHKKKSSNHDLRWFLLIWQIII